MMFRPSLIYIFDITQPNEEIIKNRSFELKKTVPQTTKWITMPCFITALKRSHTINKIRGENNKQQNEQKDNIFTAKIQHLNVKAPGNNIKMQSEKTLTSQIFVWLLKNIWDWDFILMRLGNTLTKRGNNEAKFKNQPIFSKQNIYKRLKNH